MCSKVTGDHTRGLFPFLTNNTKKEINMINPENIERIEVTTRWVSVVAAAILVGIQFTRLVQTPNEESSVDKSEK